MKGELVESKFSLLRRAFGPPDKRFENPDGSATSRVFKPRPVIDDGKLSVDVKELTSIEKAIIDKSRFILYEIKVTKVEEIGLVAIYDPLIQDPDGIENPAHALIATIADDDDILPGLLARASIRIL